jgi:hypothetical protein
MRVLSFRLFLTLRQIQNFHMASMLQIEFPSQIVIHLRFKSIDFQAGPEGFEPSTNCSAGSHSIQTELWAP